MAGEQWVAAGSLVVAALSVVATWTIAVKSEAAAERRDVAERFRPERLAAYAAFLGYARTAHREGWTSLGSRTGDPLPDDQLGERRPDLAPGNVQARLNDLAAPIWLLSPPLQQATRDAIVAVTLFLVDVENGDRRLARQEDPSAELLAFEAAASTDLAGPATVHRRRPWTRRAREERN
jgi:hypothetical protein